MSEENVELVRQFHQAFNRRDLATMTRSFDPAVEWTPGGPAAVERTVYRGRDEVSEGSPQPGRPGSCFTWRRAGFAISATRLCGWGAPAEGG